MRRFKLSKLNMFYNMLKVTNIIGFIYGFIIVFFSSALILYLFEPNFKKISDSLWFCFSSITTIGYGDLYPISLLGRLVTVLLSLYGIVFIAVITGTIINFMGELQRLRTKEYNNDFLYKLQNLENLSKDELAEMSGRIRNKKFEMQFYLGVFGFFLLFEFLGRIM